MRVSATRSMSKLTKTLQRVLRGNADANIRFEDLRVLLSSLGFAERVRGGHHISTRDGVAEILNLQPRGGKAKAYQVKQVRGIITAYRIAGQADLASDEMSNDGAAHEENEGADDS